MSVLNNNNIILNSTFYLKENKFGLKLLQEKKTENE